MDYFDSILKKTHRKAVMKRVIAVLSAVVLLFTINTTKKTADTLERIPACGIGEHVHTDACFDVDGNLVCGFVEHVHTDACYQERPKSVEAFEPTVEEYQIELGDADQADNVLSASTEAGSEAYVTSMDIEAPVEESGELELEDINGEDNIAVPSGETEALPESEESQGYIVGTQNPCYLSDIIADQGLNIAIDDVVEIGQAIENDDDPILFNFELVDGDIALYVKEDFARAELVITTEDALHVVELLFGIAPVEETGADAREAEVSADEPADVSLGDIDQEQAIEGEEREGGLAEATGDAVQAGDVEDDRLISEPTEDEAELLDEAAEDIQVEQDAGKDDETAEQADESTEEIADAEESADEQGDAVAADQTEGEAEGEQDDKTVEQADESIEEIADAKESVDEQGDAVAADETEGEAEGEQTDETEEEAEGEQAEEADGEATEEEAESEKSGESKGEQADGEATEEEAESEKSDESRDEGTEEETEDEKSDAADGEEIKEEAEDEQTGEAQGDETEAPDDGAQPVPPEVVYAYYEATIDLADVEAYPIALTDLMARATWLGVEETVPAADVEGAAAAEPVSEPVETEPAEVDALEEDIPDEGTAEVVEAEAVVPVQSEAAYELDGEDTVEPEVPEIPESDAWALDYDASVLSVERDGDDYALSILNSFEQTTLTVDNGKQYRITLLNGAAPVLYPAAAFAASTEYVTVSVEAPEGAFPAGTTMVVRDVDDEDTLHGISDKVEEGFVRVERVHAVDITFLNADGEEIEPLIPISVVMTVREIEEEKERLVVHVDHGGEAQLVDNTEPTTAEVSEQNSVVEAADESSAEAGTAVAFTAESFSVYAVVVGEKLETKVIAADGNTYRIEVTYTEDAGIPSGATLDVSEVTGDESYRALVEESLAENKRVTLARFFDIRIMNGAEVIQPAVPVTVKIELISDENQDAEAVPCAVHFAEDEVQVIDATEEDEAVSFRAESFSVWGVVYTVDFHYEIDGKEYTYCLPGGGFVRLSDIAQILGLATGDGYVDLTGAEDEADGVNASDESEILVSDIEETVKEAGETDFGNDDEAEDADEADAAAFDGQVRRFLEAVDAVTFSNPELVWTGRGEADTTIGALKAQNELKPQYSVNMSLAEVRKSDSQAILTGDWALISLLPFDTEETLTISMKNGEAFTILVTDAQLKQTVVSTRGETYEITVTYGEDAMIPEGAELRVEEILPEDERYQEYFQQSMVTLGATAPEADEAESTENDEEESGDAADASPSRRITSDYARIFDIEIWANDQKVEPASEVMVSIRLLDVPADTEAIPQVVHFAGEGAELMTLEKRTWNGAEDGILFVTDEFSVYSIVYTVDFTYEEYTYSIRGGNSILLSDMVKELHISDNDAAFMSRVKNVEFTDPALMRVTYINNPTTVAAVEDNIFDVVFEDAEKEPGSNRKLDAGEWLLTSLAPFKTEEALTITLDSGDQIVITVLDAQQVQGNGFITDAHLTIDGTTYGKDETWQVYPNVGYTLKLSFAEKGQNQFPAGGDTIVVDLPQGLTLEGNVHHTFAIPAGLAGSITGNEYWVENGKLYVKFGEDPEDILTRSSNAHFDLTFTARFDEGTTNIPFNDKVEPNIDMDITADVSVSKSASYNSTTGKMDYTITVKSTGNSEDVKVHDALTNTNLLKIDTDSIRISPAGTEYNIIDSSQGGFDMTIPSIGHNQTVTITYSADVDTSALDHKGNIKVSDDGKNTVTVGNDDDDHDDDTNTYTNRIKYSSTSKTSTSVVDHETEQDPDNKTATLGWKIVLNDNYRGSIVGDKVWDTIDWSSKDAMKYTVDENGNVTLHIAAKNQDGTKTYNTTVTAAVVTDANGVQSWEYTIPQLGDDPDEILSYEITYTTEVDKTKLDSGSNGIVKNNTTNEGDGSSTGTGVVPIPHSDEPGEDDIVGGKTAVDVTEEYVDWDIVINVPAEGFPDGLTVTDYVPMAPQYGGFADTFDSILSVTGLVGGETYTYDCVSTDKDDNGNVIWDLRNNNRMRDVVTIEFYQDAQKTTKGLGETEHARTLTIRIRTKNDPEWLAYIEREGSGDSYVYYHTNIAKANNTTFEGKAAPQKSKIYKTLIASNEKAPDGMPVYRYAIDLAGVRSLPIVIEDTFNADELAYYDYWYITDTHQYIDGKPQRHMLNNGISPYKADIVAENGKITITAEDLPRKENGDFWEYYRIYYKLKVKNQTALDSFTQKAIENGGVYNVRNTAAWNGTDDHVDIEFKVPTVEKTGAFRVNQGESGNDRLYDFAIDINKECLELNAGEPMDLTDTHTDNLTVDYTTVKVYKYVGGEKVQDTSIHWNFNGNIGTFYDLQDCTHYVIEYSCLVIGSATQSFSNYAEMNGYHSEKHDSRDFGSTVDAGADVFQIGLIKFKNGMTSKGLAGATFQLFRGTGTFHEVTNGTDTWMEEDRIPMTWGVGTETAGKVGQNITFTTGEDGYVLIALNQTDHGAELEKDVHYFLKEIESPPGYQIDSSVEYWEFTLTMDPNEVCYGTKRDPYGNRLWIYFYYDDILKMNNTETDEPITVNVDKEWFDFEGNKIENPDNLTAAVQLYQKKNNEDYAAVDTITNADGTIYQGKITLPADGSWEYSWERLPRVDTDGNGYAYKLEEVEVPEDYVSSYTLNETENEKNYHLKNYQVTERKVNVSVSKTWLDEDGKTEIAIQDLPEDLQEVQFYLYRVVSRAPFTTAPTSGGNPYTIEGNPYLVTGSGAEDGLYKITRDQFQAGISFEELPSVHKDEDGTWYFYSYYVKEVPVEGYSASVDVTETQDEQNNTILLSSMKNRKKPEERTTDLTIEKAWKDKEGGEKSWPDNTVVQFKLYQVSSTEPFNEQPTSGGTLYNVAQVNNNDHPNKVSGEDGLYQMGHTYNGEVLQTANFEHLPEVIIDANGKATYYAYYVDEVAVTGYETEYSYDNSVPGKVTVTMTNRQEPDYTQLSVEKKWFDGDNEITDADVLENLSATVELVRYRAVPVGTTVHFIMYNGAEDLASMLVPRNQTGVNITIDSIDGSANARFTQSFTPTNEFYIVGGDWWGNIRGQVTKTIDIPDVSDVYVVFGDGTVNSISVSTTSEASGGPAAIDPTFDASSYQVVLNRNNSFAHTYAKLLTAGSDNGQTYIYSYGVREVSASVSFAFDSYSVGTNTEDSGESNPGSGTADSQASNPGAGTITVNNKKKSTVDFDILKVAAGTTSPLEGAAFTIQKILETSQTAFVVTEGEAVASVPEITGSDGKVSFKGISAGCYKVKETVTPDGYIQTGEGTFYVKVDSSGLHLLEKVITDGKLSYREATTAKVGNVTISTMEGTVTFTVENTPGAKLPATGGPGTTLFYVIGSLLTLLAAALLLRRKEL